MTALVLNKLKSINIYKSVSLIKTRAAIAATKFGIVEIKSDTKSLFNRYYARKATIIKHSGRHALFPRLYVEMVEKFL